MLQVIEVKAGGQQPHVKRLQERVRDWSTDSRSIGAAGFGRYPGAGAAIALYGS